jgi:cyclase
MRSKDIFARPAEGRRTPGPRIYNAPGDGPKVAATASPHFRLEELAPGVHAARSIDGQLALCNAGIIDLGGTTVVFDAMLTPAAGLDLRRAAERLTGRGPDFVIHSHYHGDHVRGTAAIAPVHVVSTPRTRELLATLARDQLIGERAEAPPELQALSDGTHPYPAFDVELYRGWFRGILETPPDLDIVLPDVLLDARLDLVGSKRTLQVLSFGGGHSGSDVWAYLPDDRVAFLGDLFSNGYHPWMTDGDPFAFERILARIVEYPIDRALPGHGEVGDRVAVVLNREYIQRIIERARGTRSEGVGREALGDLPIPAPFERWKFSRAYGANLLHVRDALERAERAPTTAAP